MVSKFFEDVIDKKEFPFFEVAFCDQEVCQYVLEQDEIKGFYYEGPSKWGSELAEVAGKNLKPSIVRGDTSNSLILTDESQIDKAVEDFSKSRLEDFGYGFNSIKKAYVL